MAQRGQPLAQPGVVAPHFDRQRTLPRRRQHLIVSKALGDARAELQADQPRGGEHNRIVVAFVELAQARVEVAAQRFDLQVGPQAQQLHHAPQARGADARTGRQGLERREAR